MSRPKKLDPLSGDLRRACRHWRGPGGVDMWACYKGPRLTLKALVLVGAEARPPKKN